VIHNNNDAIFTRGVTAAMINEMDREVFKTDASGKRVLVEAASGEVDKAEFLE
jgi:hypothetical protein